MRIAIVTESFAPDVNGVANSVVRVAEHLLRRGHSPMVIAPAPPSGIRGGPGGHPYPVIRVASVPVPRYRGFRLGLPTPKLADALTAHAPHAVHLASPFVLGARGSALAERLGLPMLAVYQTDVPAYARAYYKWGEGVAWRWLRAIHNGAQRTLAPSTTAAAELVAHGVQRVWLWRRGVDAVRFHPAKRSDHVRKVLAPGGEVLVGYVGRLAMEKQVELLAQTCRLPGVRVVVIGDGPARRDVQKALRGALFLGTRHGDQLARLYASLDVFVHTGAYETFGQTVQEALASGRPVVAPAAGGPLDLVTSGVTGTLVPPGDGQSIADAVERLAADAALRRAYGRAARAAVVNRTWEAVGDELIDHYEAVVGAGVGAAARVPA